MKILSVDVGIKNCSFCLFETEDTTRIIKWDNIDLTELSDNKCIEIDKNGLCDKPARYIKNNKCYCLKHAKKNDFLLPFVDLKPTFVNKQKIQTLLEIADKYKVKYDYPPKKTNLIFLLNEFFTNKCFSEIQKTNATKVDLVTIGRNIQHKFDDIFGDDVSSISYMIIENQIGPIANKMKTIQGMISQYFIMKNNNIQIQFISASNKLKDFIKDKDKDTKNQPKLDYKQRKKLGIQTCLEIITNNVHFNQWENFFCKHTKKDDLSDCFLQGLWFIKHKLDI